MTKVQMNNREKAIALIENNDVVFDRLNDLWDKFLYENDRNAEKAMKEICKENGVAFKYVLEWFKSCY